MAGSNRPPRASDPGPSYALAAPAAAVSTPMFFPSSQEQWPSLNDRLAEPETPEEFIRGERYYTMGSLDPHADQHFQLDYVLAAHVQQGYVGATDLLTRASKGSDFASDTCIRKAGQDPASGTRYLEEIAFEIVNEQSQSKVTAKAEDLTRRGVRRVFAVFVKTREVKEWSNRTRDWTPLEARSVIHDGRCLRSPLPVQALLDAAEADMAVLNGILAKDNPKLDRAAMTTILAKHNAEIDNTVASILVERGNRVIAEREAASKAQGLKEGKKEGKKEGEAKGRAEAILAILATRGIAVSDAVRSRILTCQDLPTLGRWLPRALQASSADEVVTG